MSEFYYFWWSYSACGVAPAICEHRAFPTLACVTHFNRNNNINNIAREWSRPLGWHSLYHFSHEKQNISSNNDDKNQLSKMYYFILLFHHFTNNEKSTIGTSMCQRDTKCVRETQTIHINIFYGTLIEMYFTVVRETIWPTPTSRCRCCARFRWCLVK